MLQKMVRWLSLSKQTFKGKSMKKIALVAMLSAVVATPALADNTGTFYGALDVGSASYSDINAGGGVTANLPSTNAVRITGGYQIDKHIGIEASYIDLGNSTMMASALGVSIPAGTFTSSGFGAAIIGTLPLNETFSVTGKIGYNAIKATAKPSAILIAAGAPAAGSSNTNNNASFGLGIKYNLNSSFAVRAQYEDFGTLYTNSAAGVSGTKATLLSIGGIYAF